MKILISVLLVSFAWCSFGAGSKEPESNSIACLAAIACHPTYGAVVLDGATILPGGVFCEKTTKLTLVVADILGQPMFFRDGRVKLLDASDTLKDANPGVGRLPTEQAERIDEFVLSAIKDLLKKPSPRRWKVVNIMARDIVEGTKVPAKDKEKIDDFVVKLKQCRDIVKPSVDQMLESHKGIKEFMNRLTEKPVPGKKGAQRESLSPRLSAEGPAILNEEEPGSPKEPLALSPIEVPSDSENLEDSSTDFP